MSNTAKIQQTFERIAMLPHIELRSTHNSTQGYKAHSHPQLSIGVVAQGTTRLTIAGNQLSVHANDIVLIEPECVHACNPEQGKPRSYHMLYIDKSWCLEQLSCFYQQPIDAFFCSSMLLTDSELYLLIMSFIRDVQTGNVQGMQDNSAQVLHRVLTGFCSPALMNGPTHDLSSQVRTILLSELQYPPPLDLLAERFNCRVETLIRSFNRSFGITPKAFVNNARIEQSKLLLSQGENIADVALQLGFTDQSQFHKAFVNYTSSTPGQYQKSRSIFDNPQAK